MAKTALSNEAVHVRGDVDYGKRCGMTTLCDSPWVASASQMKVAESVCFAASVGV